MTDTRFTVIIKNIDYATMHSIRMLIANHAIDPRKVLIKAK